MKWKSFKPTKRVIVIYLILAVVITILSFIVWFMVAGIPPKSGLVGIPFGFIPMVSCGVLTSGTICDYDVSFNYLNLILDLLIWYAVAIAINYYKYKKIH